MENVIQNIYDKDVVLLERQKLGGHCPVLCLHTHYTHISRGKAQAQGATGNLHLDHKLDHRGTST